MSSHFKYAMSYWLLFIYGGYVDTPDNNDDDDDNDDGDELGGISLYLKYK